MFMAALFIAAKIWKQPRSPSIGEQLDNCGASRQGNIIQCQKEMSSQAMKRRGGKLKAYY